MEAEIHRALTIPEIREHILQFCSRRDLLSCRLVSKDWCDSSAKEWCSKGRIRLTDERKLSAFLEFIESGQAPRRPFVHFRVSFSLAPQTATRFWGVCGENMKILELFRCTFRRADDLRAVLFQACPNMEKLSLEGIFVKWDLRRPVLEPAEWTEPRFGEHRKLKSLTVDNRASKDTGITWMEYFSHFSLLEVLRMQGERFSDPNKFHAVTRIRAQHPSKLKLKGIHVCYGHHSFYYSTPSLPGALLNLLLDPGLQLQSLVIGVNHHISLNIRERDAFSAILNVHRASLKALELNCHFGEISGWDVSIFPLHLNNFPGQFENLTQATFVSTSISSLNFLKFTPNLNKLFLKDDRMRSGMSVIIENTDFDGMRGAPLTMLETLGLNFDDFVFSDDLQRLMELMPNVRKLKMRLDNVLFELVCQRWEKLETLEIVRGAVDSFGLIGLEGCPLFFRRCKNKSCIPFPTTTTVPKANVTCLKNLRTLSMEGRYQGQLPIPLSHWAAHLGIEQLSHLEHLRLCKYNMETICGIWERLLERYPWPKYVNSMVLERHSH